MRLLFHSAWSLWVSADTVYSLSLQDFHQCSYSPTGSLCVARGLRSCQRHHQMSKSTSSISLERKPSGTLAMTQEEEHTWCLKWNLSLVLGFMAISSSSFLPWPALSELSLTGLTEACPNGFQLSYYRFSSLTPVTFPFWSQLISVVTKPRAKKAKDSPITQNTSFPEDHLWLYQMNHIMKLCWKQNPYSILSQRRA